MKKEDVRKLIEEVGIIPAIRVSSTDDAMFAVEAVCSSGIPIVEVTTTVPGATAVMAELARTNPKLVIGAGTVLDLDAAKRCLDVGAKFLTSPGLDLSIVDFAVKHQILVFPGALTPTEVTLAWKAGADLVKIFPCAALGGPPYVKALKAPFPDVHMIASGGVTQQNAGDFILAGASAIGVGRHLVQPDAIKRRERGWIRELARRYVQMVQDARNQLKGVIV